MFSLGSTFPKTLSKIVTALPLGTLTQSDTHPKGKLPLKPRTNIFIRDDLLAVAVEHPYLRLFITTGEEWKAVAYLGSVRGGGALMGGKLATSATPTPNEKLCQSGSLLYSAAVLLLSKPEKPASCCG